jgi:hypothetical protein
MSDMTAPDSFWPLLGHWVRLCVRDDGSSDDGCRSCPRIPPVARGGSLTTECHGLQVDAHPVAQVRAVTAGSTAKSEATDCRMAAQAAQTAWQKERRAVANTEGVLSSGHSSDVFLFWICDRARLARTAVLTCDESVTFDALRRARSSRGGSIVAAAAAQDCLGTRRQADPLPRPMLAGRVAPSQR